MYIHNPFSFVFAVQENMYTINDVHPNLLSAPVLSILFFEIEMILKIGKVF
jgi:hypothetical protein